ncbi:unnamed protein product, partial [Phaedon cochleariae]
EKKRHVPSTLRKILNYDIYLSKKFLTWTDGIPPLQALSSNAKALEISCHGIPWFAFWIAFTWLFDNPHLVEMQVNMLMGLFVDIVFVAVAKAYFRRRRPVENKDDALGQMGPDVFSFPSGHASRAVFVVYFFTRLWPVHLLFRPSVVAWACAICLSRLLMKRHYLLDVLGGCLLGLFEGLLMELLWLDGATARSILSIVSDEKLDGGEYHV